LQDASKGTGVESAERPKKRARRSADELKALRAFKCQVDGCNKAYINNGSLNQHIKKKHTQ
jgi:hypothetical protein